MIFALFIFATLLILTSLWMFDRILKFQYQNYREIWEEQGKSVGYFWFSPDEKSLSSFVSRIARSYSWTFFNDEWMANEPKILRMIKFYRLCVFTG